MDLEFFIRGVGGVVALVWGCVIFSGGGGETGSAYGIEDRMGVGHGKGEGASPPVWSMNLFMKDSLLVNSPSESAMFCIAVLVFAYMIILCVRI